MNGAKKNPARGNAQSMLALEVGPVVDRLTVTSEFAAPEATCAGLKAHVVRAGKPEQEMFTVFGKVPVLGSTARVTSELAPGAMDRARGVADIEKSKAWLGRAVNVSDAEWVVCAASEPTAFSRNGYTLAVGLLTEIVNGTAGVPGTILAGATEQTGGAPVPQLRATALL